MTPLHEKTTQTQKAVKAYFTWETRSDAGKAKEDGCTNEQNFLHLKFIH